MSRPTTCRSWLLPLVAMLLLRAPLAAGQVPPPHPDLTSEARSRLAEAAGDPALAAWQREFMLEVARGRAEGETQSSLGPAGGVLRSERTAAFDGTWIMIPPPSGRFGHTAIYDPVRDRMVVFGGYDGSSRNDVWALTLAGSPAWVAIPAAGSPPSGRYQHAAIYDPVRDRMVVFGGWDGTYRNDVWALSLSVGPAWSALAPTGTPPSARLGHTAFYDPVRDRMVVFGGLASTGNLNDVWALTLAGTPAWTALSSTGTPPVARYQHTAIYDSPRDRMVIFGGTNSTISFNDVLALTLAGTPAWSTLAPTGGPPSVRYQHTAFYDPVRVRMVVFGGSNAGGFLDDVWAMTLAGAPAWSALAPTGGPPSARSQHTSIYDPVRDRQVMFSGSATSGFANDVWAMSLAGSPAWSALASAGSPPSARSQHSAIYDPPRDRMVVFGGYDGTFHNDVWALTLTGPTWSALAPTGTPPAARRAHTAIYDPVRDRMLVFGGQDGAFTLRNDVWALSLAGSPAWSALTSTGTAPTGRYGHTAIYDPVRDRMLVFAGQDAGGNRNDVRALSLAASPAWSSLTPTGTPPSARSGHAAIYDPVRDRMLVFGGLDVTFRNDVWSLSLAVSPAWAALAPTGGPPTARDQHNAFYDPARDRMVAFGGEGTAGLRNDVWALSLAGTPAWAALAPAGILPPVREQHTGIYDPVRDRMEAFGGNGGTGYRGDTWALTWGSTTSVPGDGDGSSRRFELARPRPSPSRGETFVDFDLGRPARVVLDVFDTQGRRVRRIADEWFTAGRHVGVWRGDDDRGQTVGAGVYFIRMRADGFHATRRAVRVR